MAFSILLSFQVGFDPIREIDAEKFKDLVGQLKSNIQEVSGIEVRFGGGVKRGKIVGNSIEDILEVCEVIENDDVFRNYTILHLSKLGLDLCEGNYNTDELDKDKVREMFGRKPSKERFSEEFIDRWKLAVGHYGEHDERFSRKTSDIYYRTQKRALLKDGHSKSKTKFKHVRQARDLGLSHPDLEKKLVIENGYLPYNCLPRAIEIAKEEDKKLAGDIGHIPRGLFSTYVSHDLYEEAKKRTSSNPIVVSRLERADNLEWYYDSYRKEFHTSQLRDWGKFAVHVHFHGNEKVREPRIVYVKPGQQITRPVYVYQDHRPFNAKTLPLDSLQFKIVNRFLEGAKENIQTATLELEKSYLLEKDGSLNVHNIKTSIENFKMFI